ncbi:hypothetical protein IQ254_27805 [Nodosilinea sp. LEGE 07088]|uniref:hypothetical protein n=1 Tax=Nodosilinea sp. LEGE 07088 TaxID=2777968 RepID=UPI0018803B48|nr:hypothetical protein [Nodosilinea sp. LEGE 07088]MBE9140960.1 hypothetical protein [Nodosilinea sp. LEGE 07088]
MAVRSSKLAFAADITLSGVPLKVCLVSGKNTETHKEDVFLQIGPDFGGQGIGLASLVTQILGKKAQANVASAGFVSRRLKLNVR